MGIVTLHMGNAASKSAAAKTALLCAACAALCLLAGGVSSLAQAGALESWYPSLAKPFLTPPDRIFPIAWSILYILAGVSIGLVLRSEGEGKKFAAAVFCAQMAANALWSFLFFGLRNPALALADSIVLLGLSMLYARAAAGISKAAAAAFLPYVIWCAFAALLNMCVVAMN